MRVELLLFVDLKSKLREKNELIRNHSRKNGITEIILFSGAVKIKYALLPFLSADAFFFFPSNLKSCIKILLTWLLEGQCAWLAKVIADK